MILRVILIVGMMMASLGFAPRPLKTEGDQAHYKVKQADLDLRGSGIKKILMMKVFTAKFYTAADIPTEDILLPQQPKYLEVHFFVHIGAKDFTNFTIGSINKNLNPQEVKAVSDRFGLMGEYFPDINPGDTLALTYVPGEGTSFTHNGKLRGTIPGGDFGKAIFATWIGPRPFDNHLKMQILGCLTKGARK